MAGKEVMAIVLGYLLGSIPTAYIVTRLFIGQDIRRLGGGNVGGLNTYREVGAIPAFIVGIADIGKGVAIVAIAHWLLDLSPFLVMLAAIATVVGHNWMVFLKFSGGKGMGVTLGALAVLLPVHGYWYGFLIFLGIIAVPFFTTRNVALANGIGIFFLPLVVWLISDSGTAAVLAVILGLILAIKYFPTARAAWVRVKTKKEFIFGDRPRRTNRREKR